MARKTKPSKPLIYVFCEGESEQAYTDYLRKKFLWGGGQNESD